MTFWLVLLAFISGCTAAFAWFEPKLSLLRLQVADLEELLVARGAPTRLRVVWTPADTADLHAALVRHPAGKLRSVGEGDTA